MKKIIAVKNGRQIIYKRVGKNWIMKVEWNGEQTFKILKIENVIRSLLQQGFKLYIQ